MWRQSGRQGLPPIPTLVTPLMLILLWLLQALASEEMAGAALALSHYQSNTDADEVDLDLIELLLLYICEVCMHATLLWWWWW